jgi:hypothetical protein
LLWRTGHSAKKKNAYKDIDMFQMGEKQRGAVLFNWARAIPHLKLQ